jgi:hypothetical protein
MEVAEGNQLGWVSMVERRGVRTVAGGRCAASAYSSRGLKAEEVFQSEWKVRSSRRRQEAATPDGESRE